jgi:hypothetical protein
VHALLLSAAGFLPCADCWNPQAPIRLPPPPPLLPAPQPRSCSQTASRPILDSPRQLQERGRPAKPSSSTPWCATAYAAAGALVGCVPSAGDGQTRCHGQCPVPQGGGMAGWPICCGKQNRRFCRTIAHLNIGRRSADRPVLEILADQQMRWGHHSRHSLPAASLPSQLPSASALRRMTERRSSSCGAAHSHRKQARDGEARCCLDCNNGAGSRADQI